MRPEELHERRASAGITIKRLSEISGISESTIGRIEHGYRGARERTLRQLEQALDESGRAWRELLEAARRVLRLWDDPQDLGMEVYEPAYEALREALRRLEERS